MRINLVVLSVCIFPILAQADESRFIQWHSSNVQLLRGFDYELGTGQRTIATFEHANAWRYGDFFMFVDSIFPDKRASTYYAEFSPRFSFSKITGGDYAAGFIKDVSIATTVEKPKDQKARKLYGVGVDLKLPNFTFFNANVYVRDNPDLENKTWQVTLAWKYPFAVGDTHWLVEGFADFAGSEGDTRPNQLVVPRLLLDLGEFAGVEKNTLWGGFEYSYWHNKFGVNGETESVLQLQAKWVF